MDNLIHLKILKQKIANRRLLAAALFLSFSPYVMASDDFQYWNWGGIEMMLGRRWKAGAKEGFRFENNGGSLYHYFTEIELKYILNKNFEFSVDYRHIHEKKQEDWRREYRPHINGTLNLNWRDLAVGDRSRLEYRIWEGGNHSWRYRNMLSVNLPFRWTRLGIRPYTADEVYYDFDKKTIDRNRLYLGLQVKFLRHFKGEIYYMLQSTKGIRWTDIHVLGTNLKYVF